MPKVSICIPTYNRRDYLPLALKSAYAQTFRDFEILIVDDGSTDGTRQMLQESGYSGRYYWFDHIGQQAARNKLLELAQGEYVTFLDSDDELFPHALETLVRIIDENGPDVLAFGSYVGLDEHGREIPRRQRNVPSPLTTADLFEYIHIHTGGTLFAKRLYEKEGGFNAGMKRCGTYRLMLDFSLRYKCVGTGQPIWKKRRHGGNATEMNYEWRSLELRMLEDFYYNGGGMAVVPRGRAMKRLTEEACRAASCAVREGRQREAVEMLRMAVSRRPTLKSLFWLGVAVARLHPRLWAGKS